MPTDHAFRHGRKAFWDKMSLETESKIREQDLVIEPATVKGELEPLVYVLATKPEPPTGIRRFIPSRLFAVLVLIPMVFGLVYNVLIASDRFASTTSFVVRETKQTGGIASVIDGGSGLGRSDENSYAVTEFIYSRDAIEKLDKDGFLSSVFSRPDIDVFSRFPSLVTGDAKEDFYRHFKKYVDINFNVSTGITTIVVQAFTPADAHEIARRLVAASEELVNGLNIRAQQDATRFSERLVEDSRLALNEVQAEVTRYRNDNRMLDASTEVSISSGLIGGVLKQITDTDTEISQLLSLTPNNPKLQELRSRRDALGVQLSKLRQELAGGDESIAKKIERFEEISIRQKIAENNLVSAEASLLKALQSAAVDKLYLDNVVAPNIADKFSYPKRLMNIGLVFFISFSIFIIVRSLRDLIMEDG